MRDGPLDQVPDLPALRRELLPPPDLARLEPAARAIHPPRILLLHVSLRERSFSRLLTEKAARLLTVLGAEPRIFSPRDLTVANSAPNAYEPFDDAGRMKPGTLYGRVVDVMEELMRFTWLTCDRAGTLVDRYSERATAFELPDRL